MSIKNDLPEGVTEAEIQEALAQAQTVFLKIEEHQDWLYAWDSESNEFLAQGATVNDLFERLYERAMKQPGERSVVYRMRREDGGDVVKQRLLTEQTDGAIIDDE